MRKHQTSNFFGLIIILVGVYLLAYNLNLPFVSNFGLGDIIAIAWPLLFVAWGMEAIGKKNYVFGTIFTVLGLHFLTGNLSNYFPWLEQISNFAWPVAIILIGLFVMFSPAKVKGVSEADFSSPKYPKASVTMAPKVERRQEQAPPNPVIKTAITLDAQDTTPQKAPTPNKTVSISTSFNSKKMQFTDSDFVEGENALDLSILFGDVAITLPTTLEVYMVGTVTLGDVNFFGRRYDGISQTIEDHYVTPTPSGKILKINASVMLGDLRIRTL